MGAKGQLRVLLLCFSSPTRVAVGGKSNAFSSLLEGSCSSPSQFHDLQKGKLGMPSGTPVSTLVCTHLPRDTPTMKVETPNLSGMWPFVNQTALFLCVLSEWQRSHPECLLPSCPVSLLLVGSLTMALPSGSNLVQCDQRHPEMLCEGQSGTQWLQAIPGCDLRLDLGATGT